MHLCKTVSPQALFHWQDFTYFSTEQQSQHSKSCIRCLNMWESSFILISRFLGQNHKLLWEVPLVSKAVAFCNNHIVGRKLSVISLHILINCYDNGSLILGRQAGRQEMYIEFSLLTNPTFWWASSASILVKLDSFYGPIVLHLLPLDHIFLSNVHPCSSFQSSWYLFSF